MITVLSIIALSMSMLSMAECEFQGILLAAGSSSRFKRGESKLIAPICGVPMVVYPARALAQLLIPVTVVIGFQKERVRAALEEANIDNLQCVVQEQQKGTGHALQCSRSTWCADQIVLINGDMPLLTGELLERLCAEHREHNAALTFVVAHNVDPEGAYGRLVQKDGKLCIIEAKHFTYSRLDYPLVNAGLYIISRSVLEQYLDTIEENAITKEFYITDLIECVYDAGLKVHVMEVPFEKIQGVNTLQELAHVEAVKQQEILQAFMKEGVRFMMPHTVRVDAQVSIGSGSIIEAGCQLLGTTVVGARCILEPYCIAHNAVIRDDMRLAPFSVVHGTLE